ncbi:hypothetical protein COOONC_12466 [Cooperia oncophora]
MLSAEVKETLAPRYDALEKHCQTGDMEKAAEFYHSDGVMIEKGVSVAYGRAQIKNAMQKLWDQTGPQKFTASTTIEIIPCCDHTIGFHNKFNEKYEGCEDFLILTCESTMSSVKRGSETAKVVHIWKKDQGKWTIYHEEYEVKN